MATKKSELHLFIIWKNAMEYKNKILEDIKKHFTIRNQFLITWSDKYFSSNLTRFYGTLLPDGCGKEEHIGKGEFLLVIVEDENPKYELRKTSHGEELVNALMFDKKALYRKWTAGISSHMIHATNSEIETNHDLTLLMDLNAEDFKKKYKPSNKVVKTKKDLFGAKTWNNATDMFYALNNCTNYALLRNWESLPDEIYVNEHNDIDVICESKENAAYILNARKAQDLDYRVQYYVDVDGKTANFDLRYIGDNYYDINLEKRILNNRIYNKKGFYVLNNEDYFYTLLYHATIQKPEFKEDYKIKLNKLSKDFSKRTANNNKLSMNYLEKWLLKNKYTAPIPIDETVYFNLDMLDYLNPPVYYDCRELIKLRTENKELQKRLNELEQNYSIQEKQLSEIRSSYDNLNKQYIQVVSSKGWRLLEKLRKFRHIKK